MALFKSQIFDQEISSWILRANKMADEIQLMIDQLQDIINRDSIVEIAAQVEVHQHILQDILVKTENMSPILENMRTQLRQQDEWVSDHLLDPMLESQINLLLGSMSSLEKEIHDILYFIKEFMRKFIKN